jgi:hypothetical protein
LKKPHHHHHNHQQQQLQHPLETNNHARQKIDEERKLAIEGDYFKKNLSKSSIRIFFGSKRQPSVSNQSISNTKHIKDVFENTNEVK